MWFEYWESKGIPAPKFEINDPVFFADHDLSDDCLPNKISGILLIKGSWSYLVDTPNCSGIIYDGVHLKKA